ncbi:MAG: AbrB/MazE/SpoVT family DNA-binding domain-containing protein [Synergistaceae bacterium]|nr:AbrB/MazE/SpoVT family DNA-binding domain-containing protein [Synergistaceae bacterium]
MPYVETVILSPDFQIAIPPKACEIVGLLSGEKIEIIAYDGRIELIPAKKMESFRGIAKSIDTSYERGHDRL